MSTQHCWARYVACVWPPCWAVLRHVGRCWFKFEDGQIWAKNTQHVATRCNTAANTRNMLRPTTLRYVALACSCSQYNAHTEWLIVGHYCSIMPTFQKKKKAKCYIMNNLLTWKVLSLWENLKPGSCHIRQDLGLRFPVGLQTQTDFQLHETSARNLPRFPENITCLGS